MMERDTVNYPLAALSILAISLFAYLFFYQQVITLKSLNSYFLMAAITGSFLLYADFFIRWTRPCWYWVGFITLISLVCFKYILQDSLMMYLVFFMTLLWLAGFSHFMASILTSTKKYPANSTNAFLLYLLPPLCILMSSYFLKLSGDMHPLVMDQYLMAIDGTLGIYPSLIMGRFIRALPAGVNDLLTIGYLALPLAFIAVYYRLQCLRQTPPYWLIIEFIVMGMIGFSLYNIIPGCGSRFAFASTWPDALPLTFLQDSPQRIQCASINPRNCLPSLHTAWIICLLRHAWTSDFLTKLWVSILSFATLIAMFGVGAHYLIDIVVGLAFANGIGGLLAVQLPWHNAARWQAALVGLLLIISWYGIILYGLFLLQASKTLSWSLFIGSIVLSTTLEYSLIKQQIQIYRCIK